MERAQGARMPMLMPSDVGLPKDFPMGLRVLVVDNNRAFLAIVKKLLIDCDYDVMVFSRATEALAHLRKNKNDFDVVLADVNMPEMGGFELLQIVNLEMDLPVIMVSDHDDPNSVLKGIENGACDYLVKPVRKEELKNIWQHVYRKRLLSMKERPACSNDDAADAEDEESEEENEESEEEDQQDNASRKRKCLKWTGELHNKFINAVNWIGVDRAVPSQIQQIMNVPGITLSHIASHLQKYRICLKKLAERAQNQGLPISALALSAQRTPESFAALNTELLRQHSDFFATPTMEHPIFQQVSVGGRSSIASESGMASGVPTGCAGGSNAQSSNTLLNAWSDPSSMIQQCQPPSGLQLPSSSTTPYMNQSMPQYQMNFQPSLQCGEQPFAQQQSFGQRPPLFTPQQPLFKHNHLGTDMHPQPLLSPQQPLSEHQFLGTQLHPQPPLNPPFGDIHRAK